LIEAGVSYDAFGNTTALPASDAGGSALTSTYYVDNRLASITQNGETVGYSLDPSERPRETVSTGKTASDVISHYAGEGDSPAWSEEPTNGHWTRDISGFSGLAAIQTNNGTSTVAIQLTNLHGDVIGTTPDSSETETKLEGATEASEYGVPHTAAPARYSWLGGAQRPTELPSGMIAMGARGYIPQLGRFLQTDPSPGGSTNTYGYTNNDPVNEADPMGEASEWTTTFNEEAYGAGEGTRLDGGVGIAPGAIMPVAVSAQLVEEFNAQPPWEAAAVLSAAMEAALARDFADGFFGHDGLSIFDAAAATGGGKNKVNRHGSPNEGGTGKCRSGGKMVHGKCQPGKGNVPNNCGTVAGVAGGAVGGIWGPVGAAVGGYLASEAGAAVCGSGDT
jgi:RHS repeat-associated protein